MQGIDDRISTNASLPESEEKEMMQPEFDLRKQLRRQNAIELVSSTEKPTKIEVSSQDDFSSIMKRGERLMQEQQLSDKKEEKENGE